MRPSPSTAKLAGRRLEVCAAARAQHQRVAFALQIPAGPDRLPLPPKGGVARARAVSCPVPATRVPFPSPAGWDTSLRPRCVAAKSTRCPRRAALDPLPSIRCPGRAALDPLPSTRCPQRCPRRAALDALPSTRWPRRSSPTRCLDTLPATRCPRRAGRNALAPMRYPRRAAHKALCPRCAGRRCPRRAGPDASAPTRCPDALPATRRPQRAAPHALPSPAHKHRG